MPRTHPPLMLPVTPRLPQDSAPGRLAAVMRSRERSAPRTECQDRSASTRLEATRFPAQSTFRRERSSSPLARRVLREAYGMIPARRLTHDPFRLGSTAKAFPPVAASFWLDARLVRDLSSAYLRGNKNLPSDFCHPKLSTQICTRALVARRSTRIRTRPLRGTRRFTPTEPASAGPLEHRQGVRLPASRRSSPLTPLSRSPLRLLGLSTERGLPDPPR